MANKKAVLPDLSRYMEGRKRHFITYFEGAEMYGIPYYSFVRLAKEAQANYTLRKTAIVDNDAIERYLKGHPEVQQRIDQVRRLEEQEI